MRRFLLVVAFLAVSAGTVPSSGADPVIRLVTFEAALTMPSANRIVAAIDEADRAGESLVLIELDTPGGFSNAMDKTLHRMLNAKTPVVVWVGPAGARAGSAGFFLLLAADVAAMAPGTRAGASSVVYGRGKNEEGDILLKKANQDAAALARTIAEHRGRNVQAAERAVLDAASFTDKAALEADLIDFVARSREDLLAQLHGREVKRFDQTTITLSTREARFVETTFDWKQDVMEFLATPEIAALLLLLGLGALYLELTHPGLILPGVTGLVCLVLFAMSASILPISVIGLLLILLSVVLFVLELKFVSHGLLTAGGLAALIAGGLLLVEGPIPELRLHLSFVLPSALALTALCAVAVRLAAQARRAPVVTGVQGLTGEQGTVTRAVDPEGKVFVHGEIWDAVSPASPLAPGARVRVVRVDDLRLTVEPLVASRVKEP